MDIYYGAYARFDTVSKKEASTLVGADNLVGDVFEIVFVTENGQVVAWARNKFGRNIGFFDTVVSRKLSILNARGWTLKAILSFIAYTDTPEPGHYWGEMALICFDPSFDASFSNFLQGLCSKLEEGIRPNIDLSESGISQVIESEGSWIPKKREPLPERKTGTVIMKSRRKMSEKVIEQGRKKNKGCYVLSWAFLIALFVGIVILLKSCGVF